MTMLAAVRPRGDMSRRADDRMRTVIEPLLGLPWRRGAMGPRAYDCWGLACHLQRVLFGREMTAIPDPPDGRDRAALERFVSEHPARLQWRQVDRPVQGAIVELANDQHPWHIGVYLTIDGGRIVHSQRSTGVTIDSIVGLKGAGWRKFVFHDWNG